MISCITSNLKIILHRVPPEELGVLLKVEWGSTGPGGKKAKLCWRGAGLGMKTGEGSQQGRVHAETSSFGQK